MADSAEDFLSKTASVPASIGDAIEAPPAIDGLPPSLDPLKPWKAIDVTAYTPVAAFLIKSAYGWAGKKFDPIWAMDDEEIEGIKVPLEEAVQKCLYDLRLSRVAGNPYVALLAALATLSGVKYAAIQVSQKLKELEERERQAAEREGRLPRPPLQFQTSSQSQPHTRPASTVQNGPTRGFAGESSSAGSPAPGSPNSSSIEYEPDDE